MPNAHIDHAADDLIQTPSPRCCAACPNAGKHDADSLTAMKSRALFLLVAVSSGGPGRGSDKAQGSEWACTITPLQSRQR
jgi:hypothetical protein